MYMALLLLGITAAAAQAQLAADVSDLGAIDLVQMQDRIVGQSVHLRIVRRGWNGNFGVQAPDGGLTVQKTTEDGTRVFTGRFACEGDPCEFVQRITDIDGGWRLEYELRPSADLDTEVVSLMIDLPTEGNAGKARFLASDGESILSRLFPAELPEPYHITRIQQMQWCGWLLPDGVGLMIEPDGEGITGVSLQDNREFDYEAFQAQFPLEGSRGLKAGRTYRFGLTLRPLDRRALARMDQQVIDVEESVVVDMTSDKPLALNRIRLNRRQVPQYGRLEIDLDLDATFDNPFDPEDIDVIATFRGPDGQIIRVPGFFYQDHEWLQFAERSYLRKAGDPTWRVRFAPNAPGEWTVTVTARDRNGEVASEPLTFQCLPDDAGGYVRRCPQTPYYLQFDNGRPYFAVGENICWPPGNNTRQYAEWFSSLGDAGGNYCRIWLNRWNMALEWTNHGHHYGQYYGVGKYSLDNAWRLDWVMERARENGIYCMLCLGYHGELLTEPDYFKTNCWDANPYNTANGGPCDEPSEFWTNPQARDLYRQRLRYYIARWGWDAHVLSWEFWNEVRAPAPWVAEMAKYFEQSDPYAHLVTTTYGYDEVWQVPDLDYTQAHTYGSDESRQSTTPHIANLCRRYTTNWQKPFMVGEFGIDWKTSDATHDPEGKGTSLHNGIWASIMSRSFGTAAIWYWDNYVHAKNLYGEFAAAREFVDRIPWHRLQPEFARFTTPTAPVAEDTPWRDIMVQPTMGWGKSEATDVTVNPDGSISADGRFSSHLYSDSKKDLKAPLRFHVNYPDSGQFVFHVDTVSSGADLHISVDGEEVFRKEFPAGPPDQGEYKSTKYMEQWGIWQSTYDRDYSISIPTGEHTIELENTGADWMTVSPYTFTGCGDPAVAQLDTLGLRTDTLAIAWIHDKESNWYNDKHGNPPQPQSGVMTALLGMPDGDYRIEWWNTRDGAIVLTEQVTSADANLPLRPPTFTRDIAARIQRVD